MVIARNPDPDSALPFLLRLPLGEGLLFRTKGTWPRTGALYCHPVPVSCGRILVGEYEGLHHVRHRPADEPEVHPRRSAEPYRPTVVAPPPPRSGV